MFRSSILLISFLFLSAAVHAQFSQNPKVKLFTIKMNSGEKYQGYIFETRKESIMFSRPNAFWEPHEIQVGEIKYLRHRNPKAPLRCALVGAGIGFVGGFAMGYSLGKGLEMPNPGLPGLYFGAIGSLPTGVLGLGIGLLNLNTTIRINGNSRLYRRDRYRLEKFKF